jgi:hypothetical protein
MYISLVRSSALFNLGKPRTLKVKEINDEERMERERRKIKNEIKI